MKARRMLKRQFSGYLLLISVPLLAVGALLLFRPDLALSFVFPKGPPLPAIQSNFLYPALHLHMRLSSVTFLFLGITILSVRNHPDASRDIIFWQSLMLILLSVFFGTGPFLFHTSFYSIAPAIFLFFSGTFLMAYASRNLLVRE